MGAAEAAIIREADRDWETWSDPEMRARSPIRWKMLVAGEHTNSHALTFGIAEIPGGATLPLHRHAAAEIYYILAGEGVIDIDGIANPIAAGTAIFIPANAEHRATNTGTETLRFSFAFPTDTFGEIVYTFVE